MIAREARSRRQPERREASAPHIPNAHMRAEELARLAKTI
jgi:hypothetical protein